MSLSAARRLSHHRSGLGLASILRDVGTTTLMHAPTCPPFLFTRAHSFSSAFLLVLFLLGDDRALPRRTTFVRPRGGTAFHAVRAFADARERAESSAARRRLIGMCSRATVEATIVTRRIMATAVSISFLGTPGDGSWIAAPTATRP